MRELAFGSKKDPPYNEQYWSELSRKNVKLDLPVTSNLRINSKESEN
jgi:hypothetical protein